MIVIGSAGPATEADNSVIFHLGLMFHSSFRFDFFIESIIALIMLTFG